MFPHAPYFVDILVMSASVAAIIPAFNSARTIARALDSVLKQSSPCEEIVVVDDGSSDGTSEIVERRYPQVRIVRQLNAGAAMARNRGVGQTSSSYLAFLDADDAWHSQKIALQRAVLDHDDTIGVVATQLDYVDSPYGAMPALRNSTQIPDAPVRVESIRSFLADPFLGTPSVMMRRSTFDRFGGFDVGLDTAEDLDLWLKVATHERVARLLAPMVQIYASPQSLSRSRGLKAYGDSLMVLERFERSAAGRTRGVRHGVRRLRGQILRRMGASLLADEAYSEARSVLLRSTYLSVGELSTWYLLAKSILRIPPRSHFQSSATT
jgi:glycosyltransferase involved in cell wall biosynthesis